QTVVRGTNPPGDMGTLVLTEGQTMRLWLYFPYSQKAAYRPMVPGYKFFAVNLAAHTQLPAGTKPRRVRLVFEAIRFFDSTVVNTYGAGSFILYGSTNNDPAGLPPPN